MGIPKMIPSASFTVYEEIKDNRKNKRKNKDTNKSQNVKIHWVGVIIGTSVALGGACIFFNKKIINSSC